MISSPIALAIALSAAVTPASAQQTAATPPASEGGLAEIVVTAQRRTESAARTPVTVTAITPDLLQRKAIVSEADLQTAVPGLTVRSTTNADTLTFAVRGQSIDAFSSSPTAVPQYFNEVQISPQSSTPYYDLASVQVLKGPQGTLFGRNATGGAVLFTSAAPAPDFGGYFMGRVGNYAAKSIEGAVNAPIVADRILLRIAGTYQYHKGYSYNLYDNQTVGTVRRTGLRGSLFVRLSDTLTNDLVVDYNRLSGTSLPNVPYSVYGVGSTNNGIALNSSAALLYSPGLDSVFGAGAWQAYLAAHPKAFPGGLVAFTALQQQRGPYLVDIDSDFRQRAHGIAVSNVTKLELSDRITLKNIFGYTFAVLDQHQDYDGTPYLIFGSTGAVAWHNQTRSISEELQIQGKALDDRLQFTAGVYYSHDHISTPADLLVFDLAPSIPVSRQFLGADELFTNYAVYGQGTYDLSGLTGVRGLGVTGGIRYTKVKSEQELDPRSATYNVPGFDNYLSKSVSKASWQIGLQEQATSSLLVYAVSRHSFRAGGFNRAAPARAGLAAVGGAEFDPETTTDVEVGLKFQGRAAGMPFRLNLAGFQQWVDNIQRTIFATLPGIGVASLTVNIPKARIRGIEFDSLLRPAKWFEFGGNLTYIDAEYTKNRAVVFSQTQEYGPFSDTPKWSATAFAQVMSSVPEIGELSLRGDVYTQSKFYFTSAGNTNSPGAAIFPYTLVNLRLGLDKIKGSGFSVAAGVRNLFDKIYYTGGVATGVNISVNTATPGAPRTFYVEGKVKF